MSQIEGEKLRQIWQDALSDIKTSIGENAFKTWFAKLDIMDISEATLRLMAPSNFIRDNVTTRFSDMIVNTMNSYGCLIASLNIDVYDNNHPTINENSNKDIKEESILDKRFTFKNFIVGKPNEFAHAAAIRVSESEIPSFNPLFLYGGVGLGKTHLMHAIAWRIKEIYPSKKVIYISAEKFMYLFIKALRYKDAMSFKEKFREVDVLMIDDVQFIEGKDTTQEEFFHTFNELVDNNKQIILSADKSPSDLDGVKDRLRSRLGWGLVADIHPTTYELRLGILLSKSKRYKINIPNNVLEFLAVKITSNIRELEGALNRIVAHAILVGREINIDIVHEVLQDILRANERQITIDLIQRRVCEYYGVKLSDIMSPRRHKAVTNARQIAMYLCKILTTKSLPEIGRSFGGKDHSTVIHSVNKVKDKLKNDKIFNDDLEILTKSLKS
ncbi:MAG: chromosomal replication initiator protein DnaA [Holosporales bacterium]|nr:chromosomal replication initiator protein DnaA [Holosporales bacterium]